MSWSNQKSQVSATHPEFSEFGRRVHGGETRLEAAGHQAHSIPASATYLTPLRRPRTGGPVPTTKPRGAPRRRISAGPWPRAKPETQGHRRSGTQLKTESVTRCTWSVGRPSPARPRMVGGKSSHRSPAIIKSACRPHGSRKPIPPTWRAWAWLARTNNKKMGRVFRTTWSSRAAGGMRPTGPRGPSRRGPSERAVQAGTGVTFQIRKSG